MEIREFMPADMERMKELHELCGYDYQMPDWRTSSFAVRKVLKDGGQIHAAGFLRMTTEAYLLLDGKWRTPAWRWEALKNLHEEIRSAAARAGIEDAHCWLPPELEARFAKRLQMLGWEKERPWPTYSRRAA